MAFGLFDVCAEHQRSSTDFRFSETRPFKMLKISSNLSLEFDLLKFDLLEFDLFKSDFQRLAMFTGLLCHSAQTRSVCQTSLTKIS